MNTFDLKALEKKAWKSYFDDGLWDIYLGLLLALMGISALLDKTNMSDALSTGTYLILTLIVILGFFFAKRYITVPRIGNVKFGEKRRKRKKATVLILFISFCGGLFLYLFSTNGVDLSFDGLFPYIYGANMLIVFSLMAYFLDFGRLYFIGLMYSLPVPLDFLFTNRYNTNSGYSVFIIPAMIVIAVGSWYLIKFLRTHPRLETMS